MKHLIYILLLGLCVPMLTACYTNESGLELENVFFADEDGSNTEIDTLAAKLKKYHLVDMGLSVKWAMYNYGVTSNLLTSKDYYDYAEAEALVASIGIPGLRMPTGDEYKELFDNCKSYKNTSDSQVPYRKLKSEINSNYIEVPISGYYTSWGDFRKGYSTFWTSTKGEDPGYYRIFYGDMEYFYSNYTSPEDFRHPLRLVYDETEAQGM